VQARIAFPLITAIQIIVERRLLSPCAALTSAHWSDKVSDMKKLSARQFQHGFGKTTTNLKPGQSLTITKHGKPIGVFTKLPTRRIKMPDFLGNLEATGVSKKLGN